MIRAASIVLISIFVIMMNALYMELVNERMGNSLDISVIVEIALMMDHIFKGITMLAFLVLIYKVVHYYYARKKEHRAILNEGYPELPNAISGFYSDGKENRNDE